MFRLRVKEVLVIKEISIGKLSRGADIPVNMVRRMVNDPTYIPSLLTMAKAARYLGVTVDELFFLDDTPSISEPN